MTRSDCDELIQDIWEMTQEYHNMHAEVRGEHMGINALHHAGPRAQTWVVGLGDTCLASLSHLTCSGKTEQRKLTT